MAARTTLSIVELSGEVSSNMPPATSCRPPKAEPFQNEKFVTLAIMIGSAMGVTFTRKIMLSDATDDNQAALVGMVSSLAWDILRYKQGYIKTFDPMMCLYRLCGASVTAIGLKAVYLNPHLAAYAFAASGALLTADKIFAGIYKRLYRLKESKATPLLSEKSIKHWLMGGTALSAVGLMGVDVVGEHAAICIGMITALLVAEILREKRALRNEQPSVLSTPCFQTIAKMPFVAVIWICAAYYFVAKRIVDVCHREAAKKKED